MERKNNYEIQAGQARKLFCAHDLDAVARAHGLRTDGDFLYLRLLSEDTSLEQYCRQMQLSANNKTVAIILCVVIL